SPNAYAGLGPPPSAAHGRLVAAALLFPPWSILADPALKRGRIHGPPALAPPVLELPLRHRVRSLPPDAPPNDFLLTLVPLAVNPATAPPPHPQWSPIAEYLCHTTFPQIRRR